MARPIFGARSKDGKMVIRICQIVTIGRSLIIPQKISTFHLALPVDVWQIVKSSIVPIMATTDETDGRSKQTYSGFPWVWHTFLLAHYSGQDSILMEKMTFVEDCK